MTQPPTRKLAVILHADVVGSTALVHKSESLAHERIQDVFQHLSGSIDIYNGITHELRGDALVAEFARASDAVAAALIFQRDNSEVNARLEDDMRPRVRIGISLGEVVIADHTVTGAGVVLAQRVEQLAEADGVCITGAVREAVPEHMPIDYADLGAREVKGFEQPVHVYRTSIKVGEQIPPPESIMAIPARPSKLRVLWIASTLGLMILIGGLLAWWQPWRSGFEPASSERMAFPLPDKPSIAVLPFANTSGDPQQEYLADGITENLIAILAQVPDLFVIARNSVFTYKNKPVRVQQVAEELGIRYVLEGSIQISGDRFRITVQLVDASKGNHLWSERYDRVMSDLFALQDEIALNTAMALQVKLAGARPSLLRSTTTRDVEAWLDYVKGAEAFEQFSKEGNDRARELYGQAVERDPQFADAWIGIGWTHWNDARFRYSADNKVSMSMAEEIVDKVAVMAPDNPRLHLLRGQVRFIQGDFEQAISEERKAVELSPSYASAFAVLGQTLLYAGQYDESIRLTERAMRLNPYFPSWLLLNLGRALVFKGEYDRGIEAAQRGLDRAESPFMRAAHQVTIAMAYADSGDLPRARQAMSTVLKIFPTLSIAKYAQRYRFKNPADWDRFSGALRAAGLPEGGGN